MCKGKIKNVSRQIPKNTCCIAYLINLLHKSMHEMKRQSTDVHDMILIVGFCSVLGWIKRTTCTDTMTNHSTSSQCRQQSMKNVERLQCNYQDCVRDRVNCICFTNSCFISFFSFIFCSYEFGKSISCQMFIYLH